MAMAQERSMGLFEHIRELRQRLFRSVLAWVVGTVVAMNFVDTLVSWLVQPVRSAGAGTVSVIVLSPTEAPVIYFQIAMIAGLAVALPFILYQLYGFMAPGLYPKERSILMIAIPAVLVLFVLGTVFALQFLIPLSLPVLMSFLGDVVQPTYTLENYLKFASTLVLSMGLLFQVPLAVYIIARLGIWTPKQFGEARRFVWFVSAIVAAILTPPDPTTKLLAMGPFIVLYEVGILLARVAVVQRGRADSERGA
jgi:sec-independent protein translocase protein TatC